MAESEEEFEANPAPTDFHGNKRELLKRGLEKGSLDWSEVKESINLEHLSDTELEVFLFTCKNMGIDIIGR
jgi:hypothetical protein